MKVKNFGNFYYVKGDHYRVFAVLIFKWNFQLIINNMDMYKELLTAMDGNKHDTAMYEFEKVLRKSEEIE